MGDGATGFQAEQLLQHAAWVRRVAAHLVVDAARADDVAQQTLLAALTQPPKRTDAPRAWLASVARSLARRAARSDERRARHEAAAPPAGPAPSVHEVVARAQTQRAIVDAVLALDEPYRTALLLRFFENRSPHAIAKETHAPVETVRTRLKRGLELLRARYVERRAQDWAFALVSLIAPRHWSGLRRLVAAKSSAAAVSVAGGVTVTGVLGGLAMSTSLKVAVATVVLAAGVITAIELGRTPSSPDTVAATSTSPPRHTSLESASPPSVPLADAARAPVAPPSEAPIEKPASAPTTATLEGVVVDSSGEPVADAIVLAERVEHGKGRFATLEDLIREFDEIARTTAEADRGLLRRAASAEDGSFRFEGLAPNGDWNVAAVDRKRGLALEVGIALGDIGTTRSVELALHDGVVVYGTVGDHAGRPLPGAYVLLFASSPPGSGKPGTVPSEAVIDARCGPDGTYRTLPLPFHTFRFQFEASGYVMQNLLPVQMGAGDSLHDDARELRQDCVLERAPLLSGAIVNLDGTRARLTATTRPLQVRGSLRSPESVTSLITFGKAGTVVRDDDRYEFACEMGRPSFISLWSGEVLLGWSAVPPEGEGPEVRVDLNRQPPEPEPAQFALVVVDDESGRPIPDFSVSMTFDALVSGLGTRLDRETRAVHDESGSVRFDGMKQGTYVVEVRAPQHASRCVVVAATTGPLPNPQRVELRLAKTSIAGTVVDSNGAPIVSAALCLRSTDGSLALAPPECVATTNGEGAFRFDGVPEGAFFVVAELEELAPKAVPVRGGESGVVVTLSPGSLIEFSLVRDEDQQRDANWYRILDERGIPVVDQHRPGRFLLQIGGRFAQRLNDGAYTVEITSSKWHTEPTRFLARPGAKVSVPLPAPPPKSRGS